MNPPNSPQQFLCPTCGAALPPPDGPSVRCNYCGSTVLVPPEYRPGSQSPRPAPAPAENPPQFIIQPPVVIEIPVQAEPGPRRGCTGCAGQAFILLACLLLVALFGGGFFLLKAQPASPPTQARGPLPTSMFNVTPTAAPAPPITIDLKFGSAGSGPGQFEDARYAVADPGGNIFVADYQDGRLQKFGPAGNFIQLINVPPDRNGNTIIRDLAADYRGRLYVVRGGDILVYNTSDGTLAGKIPGRFPDLIYDKLAIDPENNLYALSIGSGNRPEMVKLASNGEIIWRDPVAVKEVLPPNKSAHLDWISVDVVGNIYLMDSVSGQVLRFSTDGKFIDRFGSQGKQPSDLDSPGEIALEPTSRIAIIDNGIVLKIFNLNCSYQGYYPWPRELAYPRKLTFDVLDNLYTVTGDSEVVRLKLNYLIQ